MAIAASSHYSSALSVTVKPHHSSFFAGQDFLCTITFTNTNPRVTHTQPVPHTAAFPSSHLPSNHPAASSSSSSALTGHASPSHAPAHPPAGRRVVSNQPFARSHTNKAKSVDMDGEQLPGRKGLIGASRAPSHPCAPSSSASTSFAPWANFHSASKAAQGHRAKSASVAIGLGIGIPPLHSTLDSAASQQRLVAPAQDALARLRITPSPSPSPSPACTHRTAAGTTFGTGRKTSATISASHRHSRKKSVAQTQPQDLTEAFKLDAGSNSSGAVTAPSMSASSSSSASASVSGPSTPVSRNAAQNSPWGNENFYKLGQNDTMESVFRDSINDWSQDMRKQGGSNAGGARASLYPNNDLIAPGTERILWSFAQFSGLVEIDESLIKPGDFEILKQRLAYGDAAGTLPASAPGTPRGAIGGGDLGHEGSDDGVGGGSSSTNGRSHSWGGYLRHALGSSGGSSYGLRGRHRRIASTLQDTRERTLQSRSVPTFSSPPSILAVDLTLAPEESKSYTFRLQLPIDLPPSYHGRAIKFQYNLGIGTNKLDATSHTRHAQRSRLIQLPIRIYNHVTTSGVRPFYDLMNPIILLREQAVVEVNDGTELSSPSSSAMAAAAAAARKKGTLAKRQARQKGGMTTRAELESYVRDQLRPRTPSGGLAAGSSNGGDGVNGDESLDPFGISEDLPQEDCKAAVETLSRTSTKVSYDISKDGKVAAVLTLIKSCYRLGETVTGVISINQTGSLARIARFAATLETFEEVQPSIALLPAGRMQRMTKKVHAEYHESTLDKGRVGFALPIPAGEGPEFVTSGVKLNWTLRLSFLTISRTKSTSSSSSSSTTRLAPPVHLLDSSSDGFALYHTSKRAISSLAGPIHGNDGEVGGGGETKLETVECAVPITVLPNSKGGVGREAVFFA